MPPTTFTSDLHACLAMPPPRLHGRMDGQPGPGVTRDDGVCADLAMGSVHEVYAVSSLHAATADGFGLALALTAQRFPLIWICESSSAYEVGGLYGGGLHEWGLQTDRLLIVKVSGTQALLTAGEDALRSGAAGAVLMTSWGEARAFTLTASRRLVLAAAESRSAAVLVRAGTQPQPSAAHARWSVQAAPSTALETRAPGRPTFKVNLLRSRSGLTMGERIMEWNRETRSFVETQASDRLVSAPAYRTAGVRAA